jgi:hypothetical protein
LCEHALAIDLAALKRDGYLFTGCARKINWWRHDQIANWINYRVEEEGLRLIYRTRGPGSDWRRVDELIPFVETPTQFGGWRRWFSCPGCQRRCRILYGGAYFRCRNCQGLRYESQYEAPVFRAVSQRHKLRERLGQLDSLEAPFPSKPKGMHWKTYRRLAARDAALSGPWYEAFDELIERIDRRR